MLGTLILADEIIRPLVPTATLVLPTLPHFYASVAACIVGKVLGVDRRTLQEWHAAMWDFYQRHVLFVFENASGQQLKMYGDFEKLHDVKRAIYISNHQSTVDWVLVDTLATRAHNNCGVIRYMLKHSLAVLPLYGWYFYAHGCVYVKRGKFNSERARQDIAELRKMNLPYWLTIFPEGTRLHAATEETIAATAAFCKEQQLPPLENVRPPRSRGFQLAMSELHDDIDAVIDVTIAYSQARNVNERSPHGIGAPSMWSYVCCPSGSETHIYVDVLRPEEIPTKDEDIKRWLHDLFVRKCQRLRHFYETGAFDGAPVAVPAKSPPLLTLAVYGAALTPLLLSKRGRQLYLGLYLAGWLGGVLYMKLFSGVL